MDSVEAKEEVKVEFVTVTTKTAAKPVFRSKQIDCSIEDNISG